MSATAPSTSAPATTWDAKLYDERHAFVWQSGQGILDLLAPQKGERILDLGCGTAHLTAQIAQCGAQVIGLDASRAMIEAARIQFPDLDLQVGDARDFKFEQPFDAVFSNAALHWIRPPQAAIKCIARALKSGGRLVAEFGGRGNVAKVLWSVDQALKTLGIENISSDVNYFPAIGEYATLLEAAGLSVSFAQLFDRPTPLDGPHGLRDWVKMFRGAIVETVPEARREEFWQNLEAFAALELKREEIWHADYRRLRVVAFRSDDINEFRMENA